VAANADVPAVHAQSLNWKPSKMASEKPRAVQPFTPKIDGDLAEWPAALKVGMSMADALDPAAKASGDYYVGMDAQGISVGAFVPDASLNESGQDWSWQSDNLSLHITGVTECGLPEDSASYFQIHPIGGGKDKKTPYVFSWYGALPYQIVDAPAVMKPAKGGFTIEAKIPGAMLKAWPGAPGQQWKISLMYEDISGISQTWWEGSLSLPKI